MRASESRCLNRVFPAETHQPAKTHTPIFSVTFHSLLFDVILCKLKLNQCSVQYTVSRRRKDKLGLNLICLKRAPGSVFAPRLWLY